MRLDGTSVVLSSGPSSLHLLSLIDHMAIRDAVAPKLLRLAPGRSVGEALAEGRGQLGFTQVSELLAVQGIERLGPLGAEVKRLTVFSIRDETAEPRQAERRSRHDRFLTPD